MMTILLFLLWLVLGMLTVTLLAFASSVSDWGWVNELIDDALDEAWFLVIIAWPVFIVTISVFLLSYYVSPLMDKYIRLIRRK